MPHNLFTHLKEIHVLLHSIFPLCKNWNHKLMRNVNPIIKRSQKQKEIFFFFLKSMFWLLCVIVCGAQFKFTDDKAYHRTANDNLLRITLWPIIKKKSIWQQPFLFLFQVFFIFLFLFFFFFNNKLLLSFCLPICFLKSDLHLLFFFWSEILKQKKNRIRW